VLSLLKSLIEEARIPQEKITVFDASRFITYNIFKKCNAVYPCVIFVDNVGGDGRTKSAYTDNAIPYSVDNGKLATGLATCATEADYLINMALFKGHGCSLFASQDPVAIVQLVLISSDVSGLMLPTWLSVICILLKQPWRIILRQRQNMILSAIMQRSIAWV